jgi:hypothetical protein
MGDQGAILVKHYEHRIVVDRIKRLLAAHARQADG